MEGTLLALFAGCLGWMGERGLGLGLCEELQNEDVMLFPHPFSYPISMTDFFSGILVLCYAVLCAWVLTGCEVAWTPSPSN